MAIASAPPGSAAPLYRQVSEQLFKAIMGGEIAPGEALPTESALCARFGVSRITVRRALDELAERHLVVRRRGVGNFAGAGVRASWTVALTGFLEEVLSPHHFVIVREAVVRPPDDVLQFARLAEGSRLKLFEGTNMVSDGAPLVHLHYYFPACVAENLSAELLAGPMRAMNVVEQACGIVVDRAEQIVQPMIASGRIARCLKIPRGTAVLRAIRVYYDAHQHPVEILDAAYHPTRYRYTATLYPRAGRARSRPDGAKSAGRRLAV